MKTKYIVLLLLVSAVFLMRVDWDKVQNPEYRKIAEFSEMQRELFEKRLASALPTQLRVYLTDLTDFDWDTVCALEEYSPLRMSMAAATFYGKDIPELELFGFVPEFETAFVFLKNNKLVAVINHNQPRLIGIGGNCGSPKNAVLKVIRRGVTLSDKVSNGCGGVECDLTFHGRIDK